MTIQLNIVVRVPRGKYAGHKAACYASRCCMLRVSPMCGDGCATPDTAGVRRRVGVRRRWRDGAGEMAG